jgi:hypothetical protein
MIVHKDLPGILKNVHVYVIIKNAQQDNISITMNVLVSAIELMSITYHKDLIIALMDIVGMKTNVDVIVIQLIVPKEANNLTLTLVLVNVIILL